MRGGAACSSAKSSGAWGVKVGAGCGQGGGGLIITAMSCPRSLAAAASRRWPWAAWRGARGAQARVTIRLSHVVARQTPKGLGAGALLVSWCAHAARGALTSWCTPTAAVRRRRRDAGAAAGRGGHAGAVALQVRAHWFPEFELFDLPFLFETREQVYRAMQGALGQALLAGLARQRMVGLATRQRLQAHECQPPAAGTARLCRAAHARSCACARSRTRCAHWARGPWCWILARRAAPWPWGWWTVRKTPSPTSYPAHARGANAT